MLPWLTRLQEAIRGIPVYETLTFPYPPLFAYVITLVGAPAAAILGKDHLAQSVPALAKLSTISPLVAQVIPNPLVMLALKLPAIGADIGTGLVLGRIAAELGVTPRRARCLTVFWMLNPLTIWVSAVQGQFDPIPVFLTVVAVAMMFRGQWLAVGLALSLGTLFKAYPLLFLFVAVIAIVLDSSLDLRSRRLWHALGSLFAGAVAPVILFLPAISDTNVFIELFRRTGTMPVGAGLNLWFPAILPRFYQLLLPIAQTYQRMLYAGFFVFVLTLTWLTFRRWSASRERALLTLIVGLLSGLLLTTPLSQPQYVTWLLPFMLLGYVLQIHPGPLPLLLSVTPVLYYFALWSGNGLAFLLPLVVFWSVPVGAADLAGSLTGSLSAAGPLNSHTSLYLWLAFLVAGIVAFELLIVMAFSLRGPRGSAPATVPTLRRPSAISGLLATTLWLTALVLGAGVLTTLVSLRTTTPAVATVLNNRRLELTVTTGSYGDTYRVVVGQPTAARPVYVLLDPGVALHIATPVSVAGLLDHLVVDLRATGWAVPQRVDDRRLPDVMRTTPASIVVVPAGLTPSLAGPTADYQPATDYLKAGGELIVLAGGDSVESTPAPTPDSPGTWRDCLSLLVRHLVESPEGFPAGEEIGVNPSTIGEVLDIHYGLLSKGALVGAVAEAKGWDVGWQSSGPSASRRSSLAVVPVGKGRLVLFGSGLYNDEEMVADDIVRLLLSGTDAAPPMASRTFAVTGGEQAVVRLELPPGGAARILVFDREGFRFFHHTLEIGS